MKAHRIEFRYARRGDGRVASKVFASVWLPARLAAAEEGALLVGEIELLLAQLRRQVLGTGDIFVDVIEGDYNGPTGGGPLGAS